MISETVFFSKVKPDAQIPSKREEDAAYDVYACFDANYLIIYPHDTVLIPTGIASAFSPDYFFRLVERGSSGSKGIGQRAGIIDSGYRGEWFVGLTNHNVLPLVISKVSQTSLELYGVGKSIIVYPYDKAICQALLLPVPKVKVSEISYDALQAIKSDRGIGKIGSSGK